MSIGYVMNLIFNYKVETIYWFFGSLFGCYLAMPVFSILVKKRNILWYTVIVNFILLSCLPALKTWFGFSWGIDVPIAGSLIIYVILGYLLATQTLEKRWRITIYILGFAGFLFRFVYTYVFSIKNGKTDVSIKGYVMFHAVFLAVAVFVWGENVRWNRFLPRRLIKKSRKYLPTALAFF